jgi:hypothetical protein
MTVLGCYSQDSEWATRAAGTSVQTSTASRRTDYQPAAMQLDVAAGTLGLQSPQLPGGTVTDFWYSCRFYWGSGVSQPTDLPFCGLGLGGGSGGIFFGIGGSDDRVAVFKRTAGGTNTRLAQESGASMPTATLLHAVMQVEDIGSATGTIRLWLNGSLLINATVDLTGVVASVDCVMAIGIGNNGVRYLRCSEHIVADEDLSTWGLCALIPNANGDTNDWTNDYTAIDETTLSDADLVASATNGDNAEYNLTAPVSGTFAVRAVKVSARAVRGATGITSLAVGIRNGSGGTRDLDTATALSTSFAPRDRLMTQNPATTNDWDYSELAGLQAAIESAT